MRSTFRYNIKVDVAAIIVAITALVALLLK
jgi:hypothetical protein